MSPDEALKHQWIIQTCPHERVERDRFKTRTINPLKMLSCMRSQDAVLDPAKITKNPNGKVTNHSTNSTNNNNNINVNNSSIAKSKSKDIHGKENTVIIMSVDSHEQRMKKKKPAYLNMSELSLSSTSKSSNASKTSTPCHKRGHANMYPINFDNPSPERVLEKKKSAGKGFFNSFYLSVLKSETSKDTSKNSNIAYT